VPCALFIHTKLAIFIYILKKKHNLQVNVLATQKQAVIQNGPLYNTTKMLLLHFPVHSGKYILFDRKTIIFTIIISFSFPLYFPA